MGPDVNDTSSTTTLSFVPCIPDRETEAARATEPASSSSFVGTEAIPTISLAQLGDENAWDSCRVKVANISSLPDSWDDAGARAIAPDVVYAAALLVDSLQSAEQPPPSAIAPSPDGSIIFAWMTPAGLVEAEVESPTSIHFINPDGTEEVVKVAALQAG